MKVDNPEIAKPALNRENVLAEVWGVPGWGVQMGHRQRQQERLLLCATAVADAGRAPELLLSVIFKTSNLGVLQFGL